MQLWVGLGNPGAKYAGNRHNIGFMAIDRIAADQGFPPFKSKFQGQVSEGRIGSERIVLLKPETFMNLSGQSVGEAMRFYKLEAGDVTVFHDELDLAPFRVRLKQGGGHAGHNGLRSIHQHIGEAYPRVRLGVGHPGHKDKVASYVLADFYKVEESGLDDLMRGISDGAPALARGDGPAFQNAIALRTTPPRNSGTAKPDTGAAPAAKPAAPEKPAETGDARSPMEKLLDKFR